MRVALHGDFFVRRKLLFSNGLGANLLMRCPEDNRSTFSCGEIHSGLLERDIVTFGSGSLDVESLGGLAEISDLSEMQQPVEGE